MWDEERGIQVSDTVFPITSAGLYLADRPLSGGYNDKRNTECALRGMGTVLEARDIEVDYDSWPDSMYHGLGTIVIRECLIECSEGVGWGSGIFKASNPQEARQIRIKRGCPPYLAG